MRNPYIELRLTNVIYLGKVEHQGEIYEGEHELIIDEAIWSQARQLLQHNGRTGGTFQRNKHGALLKGLVRCAHCQTAMFHTFSQKGKRQYHYYVCSTAHNNILCYTGITREPSFYGYRFDFLGVIRYFFKSS